MVQGGEFSVCAGYRQHIWIHLSFPQKNDTSPSYPQHIWIHRPQRPFGLPHIWIHLRPQKQHIWIHFSPKNNIFGYIAFGFALHTQQKSGGPYRSSCRSPIYRRRKIFKGSPFNIHGRVAAAHSRHPVAYHPQQHRFAQTSMPQSDIGGEPSTT